MAATAVPAAYGMVRMRTVSPLSKRWSGHRDGLAIMLNRS